MIFLDARKPVGAPDAGIPRESVVQIGMGDFNVIEMQRLGIDREAVIVGGDFYPARSLALYAEPDDSRQRCPNLSL